MKENGFYSFTFFFFVTERNLSNHKWKNVCIYARESIDSEEQQRVKALEHISTRTDHNHSETNK